MTAVLKGSSTVSTAAKAEITLAISAWVGSLPKSEARKPSVFVNGASYSPLQILEEVQRETEFGQEFLAGLCEVNQRLGGTRHGSSILALIHGSTR
jgi:hypothetical protein